MAADCNVLVEFAYALNYSSRTKSDNWVSYKSVCDWYGVDCTSDGQHVSKLDLPANNLVGELDLAAHIAPLQYVKYVDLTNNKITNTSAAMNLGQAIKTIATSSYENQLVLKLGWNKLEGNLLGL
ncbi:MAG: hypothetical protein H6765_00995 [Candidatus Peribacteria bacterium]|nr:MAG: hypothetical protein H6765_00995 [Candidatus Peribacteria bacterium]